MPNVLTGLFNTGSLTRGYNGLKNIIGNIYTPVHKIVHTVSDVVHGADKYLTSARSIPFLRDLVSLVQANPVYSEILNLTDDITDVVDYGKEIGKLIDQSVSEAISAPDFDSAAKSIGKSYDRLKPIINPLTNPALVKSRATFA